MKIFEHDENMDQQTRHALNCMLNEALCNFYAAKFGVTEPATAFKRGLAARMSINVLHQNKRPMVFCLFDGQVVIILSDEGDTICQNELWRGEVEVVGTVPPDQAH